MFIIYDKDMNVKPFPKGVHPLDIYIQSIPKKRVTESVEGRHGTVSKGFTYEQRPIELEFLLIAYDTVDYRLLRDETYAYLTEDDYFYVSETYQKGKIYKVTVEESFIPDRSTQVTSSFRIPLETVDLPFAKSVGTTHDIDKNGINYDDGLWSYGMGLLYDDESHKYTHSSRTFRIYNAGNVPEHNPFEEDLKITIIGANYGYELKNKTTGDVFKLIEQPNGVVVLDGGIVTDNDLQALRKTNKVFISLSPGWNEFEQSENATVIFDFPFYYL